jgi:hypothetical protein
VATNIFCSSPQMKGELHLPQYCGSHSNYLIFFLPHCLLFPLQPPRPSTLLPVPAGSGGPRAGDALAAPWRAAIWRCPRCSTAIRLWRTAIWTTTQPPWRARASLHGEPAPPRRAHSGLHGGARAGLDGEPAPASTVCSVPIRASPAVPQYNSPTV